VTAAAKDLETVESRVLGRKIRGHQAQQRWRGLEEGRGGITRGGRTASRNLKVALRSRPSQRESWSGATAAQKRQGHEKKRCGLALHGHSRLKPKVRRNEEVRREPSVTMETAYLQMTPPRQELTHDENSCKKTWSSAETRWKMAMAGITG